MPSGASPPSVTSPRVQPCPYSDIRLSQKQRQMAGQWAQAAAASPPPVPPPQQHEPVPSPQADQPYMQSSASSVPWPEQQPQLRQQPQQSHQQVPPPQPMHLQQTAPTNQQQMPDDLLTPSSFGFSEFPSHPGQTFFADTTPPRSGVDSDAGGLYPVAEGGQTDPDDPWDLSGALQLSSVVV